MNNSEWRDFATDPPPDGMNVLCYLKKPRHQSRYVVRESCKIANGFLVIIGGLFGFDSSDEILCWKELDEDDPSIPLKYKEEE